MTDDEIAIVQESWTFVIPIADAAMKTFYDHLFQLDENVAMLFVGKDMAAQRSHLANALDLAVGLLHQPEALIRPLRELGARHATYGVAEEDFVTVGEALLSTLEQGLSDRWTQSHEKAWAAAWEAISTQVLVGFRDRRAA